MCSLFILLVRLPVNNRLLLSFGGGRSYTRIFNGMGAGTPNPYIQGSTVYHSYFYFQKHSFYFLILE